MTALRKSTITIAAFTIVLSLVALFRFLPEDANAAPALQSPPVIRVFLDLDKREAFPDTTLRLTEFTAAEFKAKVRSVKHTVYRVGKYDENLESLVNFDSELHKEVNSVTDKGLPLFTDDADATKLSKIAPGKDGFHFDFKMLRVGIFKIIAEWSVENDKQLWQSPSIFLTVRPPVNKFAKVILKKEWFQPD